MPFLVVFPHSGGSINSRPTGSREPFWLPAKARLVGREFIWQPLLVPSGNRPSKRKNVPIGNFAVAIAHVSDAAVLRHHNDYAFGVLPAETIGGSVSRSGLISTLLDCLGALDVEGSINHLVFVGRHVNFGTESYDLASGGQHQGAIRSHQIGQEVCVLENRLVYFGQ